MIIQLYGGTESVRYPDESKNRAVKLSDTSLLTRFLLFFMEVESKNVQDSPSACYYNT
jgi:hypothetical protein